MSTYFLITDEIMHNGLYVNLMYKLSRLTVAFYYFNFMEKNGKTRKENRVLF